MKDQCAYAHHISKEQTNRAHIDRQVQLLQVEKETLSEFREAIHIKLHKIISNELEILRLKSIASDQSK